MTNDSQVWPPNYDEEYIRRATLLLAAKKHPELAAAYYESDPVAFIEDFCFTFDPRKAGAGGLAAMPFKLFDRQKELVIFFDQLLKNESAGLVEKARDMGATWVAVAFAVWIWLYKPGASIGFGSRKELLVDRLGDMDSIFEKIRWTVSMLPGFILPKGFDAKQHSSFMKLLNPANDASITGEAGNNIGRGGRKLIFFKDESAHYENPKLIEAALLDNTNVQVDISSVNGTGNVFHKRRTSGVLWDGSIADKQKTQVFIMDWRDHPGKDQAWYDARKARAEADGLLAEHAQEVDRDYSSAVLGTIIKSEWIQAAIGLAQDFDLDTSGKRVCGLDVADDGVSGDKNALALIHGLELVDVESWGMVDTSVTATKAYNRAMEFGTSEVQYDAIGVGSGVKGQFNAMKREGKVPESFKAVPWMASASPRNPYDHVDLPVPGDTSHQGPINKDFFSNLKAQAWWALRNRFRNSYQCRKGLHFDKEQVISISPSISADKLQQLTNELSQATREENTAGKMKVNKSPNGTASPNIADAIVMAAYPVTPATLTTKSLSF